MGGGVAEGWVEGDDDFGAFIVEGLDGAELGGFDGGGLAAGFGEEEGGGGARTMRSKTWWWEEVKGLLKDPRAFNAGVWRASERRGWHGEETLWTFPTYEKMRSFLTNYRHALYWDWWHPPHTITDGAWKRLYQLMKEEPRDYVYAEVFLRGRERLIVLGWHEKEA